MKEQKNWKHFAASKPGTTMYRTYGMILLVLAITFFIGLFYSNVFAHENGQPVTYKYYTSMEVESGDTLWSIAVEYADENYISIEDYIQELKYMNNMTTDTIIEGHYLTISYYSDEYK